MAAPQTAICGFYKETIRKANLNEWKLKRKQKNSGIKDKGYEEMFTT